MVTEAQMPKLCCVVKAIVFSLPFATAIVANAQKYPTKPIRIITNEAGGPGDIIVRMMQPSLNSNLGQPVVIDNRPLIVAGEIVANALPDGYTVAVYGGTLWLGPLLQSVRYDPVRDFAPVTMVSRTPAVVLVHPSVPVSSIKELIALAKAKPGVLNYGSGASGSLSHLAVELLKSMAGVNIVRIPYKGAGPAANALIAGEVQVMLAATNVAVPNIKAGRVRPLAVSTAQRSALIPELPTVAETGLPGYEASSVFAMVTTAKTPAVVINRLNQAVAAVVSRADIKERFLISGAEAISSTPEELAVMIKSEMTRMGKVIKDAGIRAE